MDACLYQVFDAEQELKEYGCNSMGLALMAPKARFYSLKLRRVPLQKAIVIKQEALSQGAEAVLPREAMELQRKEVDLLLMGTERQLEKLCSKLKLQPDSLTQLGEEILDILRRARRHPRENLQLGSHRLPLGKRTLIMAILNLTPDSFSDGGRYNQVEAAVTRARQMVEEGADIIDLGGESTRPGFERISVEEELNRVMPVIEALKKDPRINVPLSIDTHKAGTAQAALKAGVEMVNDVWGLKADPEMGPVVAQSGAAICLMHNRTHTDYQDLIPDIIAEMRESLSLARQAGIRDERIIVDPGIGFGKDLKQNLEVMHRLRDFRCLGCPILLGTSRKSMIGKTLDLPVNERLEGTAATVAYGISAGADIVRVHDIAQMKRVVQMTDAMVRR
jgi:dihydropteroate synthase